MTLPGKIRTMIHSQHLENGLHVLLEPAPTSKLVSVELHVPSGALTEPESHLGISSVLEEWLWRGAGERDARALEDAWDTLGAQRGSELTLEGMGFSAACLLGDAGAMLELLADVVMRPKLADDGFAPSLDLARAALVSLDDAPDELLYQRLWRAAFENEFGRSPYGSQMGFSSMSPALVRDYQARTFTPHGSVLAVSGALEWAALLELVAGTFGDWRGEKLELPQPVWSAPFQKGEARDTAQTQIGGMMPITKFCEAGYYESRFACEVLGGGNSNRLFNEIREVRGLVYGVHAGSTYMPGLATLEVFASCTPARASETLQVMREEMRRWTKGITEDEFERARVSLLTNLAMSEESTSARAASLLRDARLLGRAREVEEVRAGLESVTLEGINAWLESVAVEDLRVFVLGAEAGKKKKESG
jgi:predicted Zn-dependent peptidase